MKYIRLISGIGFWVENDIANKIAEQLRLDKTKFIELGDNLIPLHQFAGIFDEQLGDDLVAKDRGLVRSANGYATPQELLGLPLKRYQLETEANKKQLN